MVGEIISRQKNPIIQYLATMHPGIKYFNNNDEKCSSNAIFSLSSDEEKYIYYIILQQK